MESHGNGKANLKQLKTCSIKVTTTHTDKHQSPIVTEIVPEPIPEQ